MARVFIPALLADRCDGLEVVEAPGSTVREVLEALRLRWPELGERLLESGRLRTGISVAVDGELSPMGLLERVSPASEIHFVLAVSGG